MFKEVYKNAGPIKKTVWTVGLFGSLYYIARDIRELLNDRKEKA